MPQVVNGLGLCTLLLHDVNVQEKRGAAAAVGDGLGCGWFIGVVWLRAPSARAGGDGRVFLVLVGVLALGVPVSLVILITKRASRPLTG